MQKKDSNKNGPRKREKTNKRVCHIHSLNNLSSPTNPFAPAKLFCHSVPILFSLFMNQYSVHFSYFLRSAFFILYMVLGHALVLHAVHAVMENQVHILLGILLLGVLCVEPFAHLAHIRAQYAKMADPRRLENTVMVLGIGRICIHTLIGILIVVSLPGGFTAWWAAPILIGVVLKEAVLIAYALPQENTVYTDMTSWKTDIILWLTLCILYTTVWQGIFFYMPITHPAEYIGAMLLFVLCYLPLISSDVLVYRSQPRSIIEHIQWWATLDFVMLVAIFA
jgi:hypothetical protein